MNETERLEELRAEITARLKPVCVDWPEETFDAMVAHIASVTLKYEDLDAGIPRYDRRATERLVRELKALMEKQPRPAGDAE